MPREYTALETEDKSREDLTRECLQLFSYAEDYRKPWEDPAGEWYQLYCGYIEQSEADTEFGRATIRLPWVWEQIDTWRARAVEALFGIPRPWITGLPKATPGMTPEKVIEAEEDSKLAAAVIDDDLAGNNIYLKWYLYTTNWLLMPCAIMSLGWRYEERRRRRRVPLTVLGVEMVDAGNGLMVPRPKAQTVPGQWREIEEDVVVYDGNELSIVDWWDFWFDPHAMDLDSSRFTFERQTMTWEELEDRQEQLEELDAGTVFRFSPEERREVETSAAHLDTGRWDKASYVGHAAPEDKVDKDSGKRLVEVLTCWEDDACTMIVNRKALAYYGGNHFNHGRKPYIAQSFDPLASELYGLTAAQIIHHMALEGDTITNQRLDLVNMMLNAPWLSTSDVDESELYMAPNHVIKVPDLERSVKRLDMGRIPAEAYQDPAMLKQLMDSSLGTPPIERGAAEQPNTTATEIAQRATKASIRYEVKIKLLRYTGLDRLFEMMDLNNQQLMPDSRLVKFWDERGVMTWRQVDLERIMGEHEYTLALSGTDPSTNRDLRRQLILQLAQVLKGMGIATDDNQIAQMLVDAYSDIIRNAKSILVPPEVAAQQAQAEAAAAAQAQQQAEAQAQQQEALQEREQTGRDMERAARVIAQLAKLFGGGERGAAEVDQGAGSDPAGGQAQPA